MSKETNKRAKVFAVTSGKGGVGKTNFVMNIGVELALQNYRVILIDSDIGLANLHLHFDRNISEKGSIINLLKSGKKSEDLLKELESIIYKPSTEIDLHIIAGSCAHEDIFNLTSPMKKEFETVFKKLIEDFDIILFDCGAGITKTNTFFEGISDQVIICTNFQESAVIGAYAKIKVNVTQNEQKDFSLIVNKADRYEGISCYKTLSNVIKEKLETAEELNIEYLGNIRKDDTLMKKSSAKRLPIYCINPDSEIRRDYFNISQKLIASHPAIDTIGLAKAEESLLSKIMNLLFPKKQQD